MEDRSLYLSTQSNLTVKIHPVVIFSILDSYVRRNDESQTRVIGSLLGTNIDGVVEIKNSFPVPHTEGEAVAVEMEFHATMIELHHKASPKEMIVGWYSTGAEIDEVSAVIHDFYSKEMTTTPVHITVDTALTNNTMAIKAYTSTSVSFADKPLGSQFLPLPCEIEAHDAEKIGVDVLIKAKNTPNMLLADLENLENSVEKLIQLIDTVYDYVSKVLDGKVTPDNKIGRFLADAVASLPKFDLASWEKVFNNNLQDLLMVIYLANLTRTQLSLAEKLQKVV